MFEWVTHATTRVRMLKLFFKEPSKPLYGLEIAKALRASPGTIHRELNALLTQQILLKKKEGALVMYRLNTHHPYFVELKKALFPKKRSERVLLLSHLHLSPKTDSSLLEDLSVLLDYAQEHASELVFLGNTLDQRNLLQTFLTQQSLFDRINALSHDLTITVTPGDADSFLNSFVKKPFFGSSLHFLPFWSHKGLQAIGTFGVPEEKFEKAAYLIYGTAGAKHREKGKSLECFTGSFEKERTFIEIDQEGAAVVRVKDLR